MDSPSDLGYIAIFFPTEKKFFDSQTANFYKCRACPYRSKSIPTIESHTAHHKKAILNPCRGCSIEKYKCSSCNFHTHLRTVLALHKESSHRKPPKQGDPILWNFGCKFCGSQTYSRMIFLRHVCRQSRGTRLGPATSRKWFECATCFHVSRTLRRLDGHMCDFKCEKCPYRTNMMRSWKRHAVGSHGMAPEGVDWVEVAQNKIQLEYGINCLIKKPKPVLKQDVEVMHEKDVEYMCSRDSNVSVLKRFECTKCPFQTDHQNVFKKHTMAHATTTQSNLLFYLLTQ